MESFFAKKDKKKRSKKETFTPDDLLKKIELDNRVLHDNGYDSNGDVPQKVALTLPASINDEGEWDEPETDKEVDMSLLKMQNLVEKEKERQEVEEQEELQKAVEESKTTMKWNIAKKEESSDDEEDEKVSEEKQENNNRQTTGQNQDTANGTRENQNGETATTAAAEQTSTAPEKSKYIPPAMRNAMASQDVRAPTGASGISLEKMSLKRPGHNQKIDVSSVDQFPSLGMAVQKNASWGPSGGQMSGPSFTSVRKGGRGSNDTGGDGALSTSNKYQMLQGSRH